MGFRDMMREQAQQQALKQVTPSETAVGQRVANILTAKEYELFAAIQTLVEAADDVDDQFRVTQEMTERRDELLDVADHVAEGDFEEWWWSEYAPQVIDDVETARVFAGLEKDEWAEAIGDLADYRRQHGEDVDEDAPDAQLAAERVDNLFGMTLAEFSDEVVEWSASEHVKGIVERNLQVATESILQVAAILDDAGAGDDVQEDTDEDVDEGGD